MEYVSEEKMQAIFDEIDASTKEQQEAYRHRQALTHRPWGMSDSLHITSVGKAASAIKMNYIINNWKILADADQRLIQERIERDSNERI